MQQESSLTYLSLKDDDYLQEAAPQRNLGFIDQGQEEFETETALIGDSNVLRTAATRVQVGVNPMLSQLMVRQKKSKSNNHLKNRTDQQKKLDLISRITDPSFNREESKRRTDDRKKAQIMAGEEMKAILVQMVEANEADRKAMQDNQSAMHRFVLLPELTEMLRKKAFQTLFLEMQGCTFLETWLEPTTDGTFPPLQVIETVFEILENLPVDEETLQGCNIAKTLQLYAAAANSGCYNGNTAALTNDVVKRATHLLQRWQVTVYQLSYEYDQNCMHELKQRDLKRKLAVLKDFDTDFGAAGREDDLIRKPVNGQFQFQKSNFDFLEKPDVDFEEMESTKLRKTATRTAKQEIAGLCKIKPQKRQSAL